MAETLLIYIVLLFLIAVPLRICYRIIVRWETRAHLDALLMHDLIRGATGFLRRCFVLMSRTVGRILRIGSK